MRCELYRVINFLGPRAFLGAKVYPPLLNCKGNRNQGTVCKGPNSLERASTSFRHCKVCTVQFQMYTSDQCGNLQDIQSLLDKIFNLLVYTNLELIIMIS